MSLFNWIFFKSLRLGEKDNVSCVDSSSIQASLISHRIFMLLDKHDQVMGGCYTSPSVTKENGARLSWLLNSLAFRSSCYLELHKSTGALLQVGGCKSNLVLDLKMSFGSDLIILIWLVCFVHL